jgi:hypothetical protein
LILKKSCPGTKLDLNFSDIQQAILKIATKTQRHKEIKYMNFTPLSEKDFIILVPWCLCGLLPIELMESKMPE